MRVPRTGKRLDQVMLKEINPEYSLEKSLILGKIEGWRRRLEKQRIRWLDGVTDSIDMHLKKNSRR